MPSRICQLDKGFAVDVGQLFGWKVELRHGMMGFDGCVLAGPIEIGVGR